MSGAQEEASEHAQADASFVSRTAVLADAEGLLTCYGVGEQAGRAALTHAVIELCFTSSVRFLQPGLLLKARAPSALAGVPFLLVNKKSQGPEGPRGFQSVQV